MSHHDQIERICKIWSHFHQNQTDNYRLVVSETSEIDTVGMCETYKIDAQDHIIWSITYDNQIYHNGSVEYLPTDPEYGLKLDLIERMVIFQVVKKYTSDCEKSAEIQHKQKIDALNQEFKDNKYHRYKSCENEFMEMIRNLIKK